MPREGKEEYSENKARYKAFMLLVTALVIILVGDTICLWFNKITPEIYKETMLLLGIPTLLGMAFHAFFVTEDKKGDKDVKATVDPAGGVSITSSEPGKSGGPIPSNV